MLSSNERQSGEHECMLTEQPAADAKSPSNNLNIVPVDSTWIGTRQLVVNDGLNAHDRWRGESDKH